MRPARLALRARRPGTGALRSFPVLGYLSAAVQQTLLSTPNHIKGGLA
jgi:hypothetical protein